MSNAIQSYLPTSLKFSQSVQRPQIDYVFPGLTAGSVGMVVGQGSMGKSLLSLYLGVSMTCGLSLNSTFWDFLTPGKSSLFFAEESDSILLERMHGLRRSEYLSEKDISTIESNLSVYSMAGEDMRLLATSNGSVVLGPFFETFKSLCVGQRLVVIDSLTFLSDFDEKDSGKMLRLMQVLAKVAKQTNAAIIVLHHIAKDSSERCDWFENVNLISKPCRWQIDMRQPTKSELAEFFIAPKFRFSWIMVAQVKVFGSAAQC
jgi:RecA-family ATPase